jgi:hypothetical protein
MPGELAFSFCHEYGAMGLAMRAWLCAHETASQCLRFSVLARVSHARRLKSKAQAASSAKIDCVNFNVGIHLHSASMLFESFRQQFISCGIFATSKAERKSVSCRQRTWVPSGAICANVLRPFASRCLAEPAVGLQLWSLRLWRS